MYCLTHISHNNLPEFSSAALLSIDDVTASLHFSALQNKNSFGVMMLRSKDALRIVPYFVSSYSLRSVLNVCHWHTAPHNPAQYSHIVKLDAPLLCSYRGGSLSHKTTPVQAHRGFRLLTLHHVIIRKVDDTVH